METGRKARRLVLPSPPAANPDPSSITLGPVGGLTGVVGGPELLEVVGGAVGG